MARRKITEPPKLDAADLPELTPQQQTFVQGLLAGKTASDAYRAAFDCRDWLASSIWCEASKLGNSPKVLQWLSAARKACLGTAHITLEQHVRRLDRLAAIAIETGNIGAAVQAESIIGKVAGHHIERIQEVTADPHDTLKTLAQTAPALAAQLAAAAGIPWATADEHATKH